MAMVKTILNKFKFYFLLVAAMSIFLQQATAAEVLSWQECLKEAAKNQPDLIAASQEVKQSQAAKTVTASTLFPQVNASASASTSQSSSASGSSAKSDAYGYGVNATQLFFNGAKTINNVKAAAENINAARQNFRFTSVTVRFRLRNAFIDLLKAQEALKIAHEIFEIRRENLELITLRYESGLEHKGALLTSEADLASANYEISHAKRSIEVAQRALTKELGRLQLIPITVKGDFEIKDPVIDKPDFEAIVKNNPSVLQLVAQKNAANFNLKSAYGNFSPTLSGSAGASKTGSHWAPRGNEWDLGLELSLPIFEGGLRLAQVSQAQALLNQLKENERSTKDAAILTLEEAWAGLQDAVEGVMVENKVLGANEERSKIAQAQYSTGFINFDNWIIIENNLVTAKRAYLDAQANELYAQASWIQAKGETIEYE